MRVAPPARPLGSAPAAFRKDLERQPVFPATEEEQGAWIVVAAMLSHAIGESEERRSHAIAEAAKVATEVIGAAEVQDLFVQDPNGAGAGHDVGRVRLLIERMEEADALHLAKFALDSLRAIATLTVKDDGRLLALQARLSWKMGNIGLANDLYRQVEAIGRREREPELTTRAWIGLSVLAQMSGNFPDVRRLSERALELAQAHGLVHLAAMAHRGIMMTSAMTKDFDRAIVHGWAGYSTAAPYVTASREALNDLGQILLAVGQPAAARIAFSALLGLKPRRRIAFPAAGGLATASAALGDMTTVRWVTDQVERQAMLASHFYPAVFALLDCAAACAAVGEAERARVLATNALQMARDHGFNEIAYRAEELISSPPPAPPAAAPLSTEAAGIVERVTRLHADPLPERLELVLSASRTF